MKNSTALLLALVASLPLTAQEGGQKDGQGPPKDTNEPKEQELKRITDMERMFRAYGAMHGGRDRIQELKTFAFRMIPHEITDGGEVEQAPMSIDVQFRGPERVVRIAEEIDERAAVKIVDASGVARVWLDGEEREIPELKSDAAQEGTLLLTLLDLVYNLESEDLRSEFQGERKRNGQRYLTADFEFHPSRLNPLTYRVYFHSETGMVERIDAHDTRRADNRRVYTIRLTEYAPIDPEKPRESLKFPGRIEILDPEFNPGAVWRWVEFEANPERDSSFFRES